MSIVRRHPAIVVGIVLVLLLGLLGTIAYIQALQNRQQPVPTLTPAPTRTITPTPTLGPSPTPVPQKKYLPLLEKAGDLQLEPPPTPTPSPRPTSPNVLATATVTPPPASGCTNVVQQGDFSESDKWQLSNAWITAESARQPGQGQLGLFLGMPSTTKDVASWSIASQVLALPPVIVSARLSFWHYDWDAPSDDRQIVEFQTPNGQNPLPNGRVFDQLRDKRSWQKFDQDVTSVLQGHQSSRLVFAVSNNGDGRKTYMRVDDVTLEVCTASK